VPGKKNNRPGAHRRAFPPACAAAPTHARQEHTRTRPHVLIVVLFLLDLLLLLARELHLLLALFSQIFKQPCLILLLLIHRCVRGYGARYTSSQPETRNPKPETRNPKPETQSTMFAGFDACHTFKENCASHMKSTAIFHSNNQ